MTSTVAIHLTECGMWSCSRNTSAATFPTVRAGSDGSVSAFAAAESDHEMTPLCFVDDEYVDVDGGVAQVSDALTAVLRFGIDAVGQPPPIETVVLSCPSEWGSAKRSAFSDVGARVAAGTAVVPVAVAAAESASALGGRWVVIECRAVGVTASYVVGEPGGYRIVKCEHDPTLCAAEALDGQAEPIVELGKRTCGDRLVDGILVTGIFDPTSWETIRDAARAEFTSSVQVECIPGDAIARALESGIRDGMAGSPMMTVPQSNWLGPALQRSERSRRTRPWPIFAAVAAVSAVVLGAVVAVAQSDRAIESVLALDANAVPETSTANSSADAGGAPVAGATDLDLDGIRVTLPYGWSQREPSLPTEAGMRVELIPSTGPDRRIILMQNAVRDGAGYDEVAATLSEKIAQHDRSDLFGAVERDVVFGGRPGVSYSEFPDESSSVTWHVLVERGRQVSVGCQFSSGDWESILRECEEVVRSLAIAE
ncbi:type VII secretion-associated protein [Rhodococcus sp. NPDC049939]|uniref:type VII secretion-associated protein n=1 Tax=Rhodococcus sp. NPDC049939 TaxID=3155511 RepID=UPI0033FB0780